MGKTRRKNVDKFDSKAKKSWKKRKKKKRTNFKNYLKEENYDE